MDVSLSELRELVMDREAWRALKWGHIGRNAKYHPLERVERLQELVRQLKSVKKYSSYFSIFSVAI